MPLTVQQIIAKVAGQKQIKKFLNLNKDGSQPEKNSNNKSFHNVNKNLNSQNHKYQLQGKNNNSILFDNFLSKQASKQHQNILQNFNKLHKKYKNIKFSYQKEQIIDKKYSQIQQKLKKVIKQNKKLQQQINVIRVKTINVTKSENQQYFKKSCESKENKQKSTSRWRYQFCDEGSKNLQKNKNKSLKYQKIENKNPKLCDCNYGCQNINQYNQKSKESVNQRKFDSIQNQKLDSNKKQNYDSLRSSNEHLQQVSQSKETDQVFNYENLAHIEDSILRKQSQIIKLKQILSHQKELINQYQLMASSRISSKAKTISKQNTQLKQQTNQRTQRINNGKPQNKNSVTACGTIVKIKRNQNQKQVNKHKYQQELSTRAKHHYVIDNNTIKHNKSYSNSSQLQKKYFPVSFRNHINKKQNQHNQTSQFILDVQNEII